MPGAIQVKVLHSGIPIEKQLQTKNDDDDNNNNDNDNDNVK